MTQRIGKNVGTGRGEAGLTVHRTDEVRRKLLKWYRASRRSLPWRSDRPDPYHVMVSEAMLQQTQVATVIDYFNRFIAALPTVADLAAAPEQQVLTLWQGLGYYRRARGLHGAAREIMARFAGRVPDTVEDLLSLPGVGRYTAGAIASIAYGRAAPIVDGNVARVLSRVLAIQDPIESKPGREALWSAAGALVPPESPGDFNQAMMELGAMVCTPRQPGCMLCPLQEDCQALARGLVQSLPARLPRRKPMAVTHHILAVGSRGQWFFERRPDDGLWSGMWHLPTHESLVLPDGDDPADVLAVAAGLSDWLAASSGLRVGQWTQVGEFSHQTTHRTIRFLLWRGDLAGRRAKVSPDTTWRTLDDLADLPLPNPQQRAVGLIQSHHEDKPMDQKTGPGK